MKPQIGISRETVRIDRYTLSPDEARAFADEVRTSASKASECWARCPDELDWFGSGGHGRRAPRCDLQPNHAGDHAGYFYTKRVTARVTWARRTEDGAEVSIVADVTPSPTERERIRAALTKYGAHHLESCERKDDEPGAPECTCGLAKELG